MDATCFSGWIQSAPVGAGLDAIPATDVVVFIHQDYAVGGRKCGSSRAHLNAGCFRAVVAEFWDEEGSEDVGFDGEFGEAVNAPIRAVHSDLPVGLIDVAFDSGIEEAGFLRYVVFDLAGHSAAGASDAFLGVHPHGVKGLKLR